MGKSSLMNALLSAERAIVTDVPGTTRDVLSERFTLGGKVVRLSDTAGIRESADAIERMGVERAQGEVGHASRVAPGRPDAKDAALLMEAPGLEVLLGAARGLRLSASIEVLDGHEIGPSYQLAAEAAAAAASTADTGAHTRTTRPLSASS